MEHAISGAPGCRNTWLPDGRSARQQGRLPDRITIRPPGCRTTEPPDGQSARLYYLRSAGLPEYTTTGLPEHCLTVRPPNCMTAKLLDSRTAKLHDCQTANCQATKLPGCKTSWRSEAISLLTFPGGVGGIRQKCKFATH